MPVARTGSATSGAGAVRALLPVRFFFGATFLYAGFDKLVDPRFFDPASPASIQAQMAVFTRASPIAALVRLGQPMAVAIGLVIAIAEIAIGLGALTGLAFRLAAWGGAVLSIVFFLTASWTTRPFYYGPDLPYAAGWIALALAGHGGQLVSHRLLAWAGGTKSDAIAGVVGRRSTRRSRRAPATVESASNSAPLRDRRTVLQAGVLGLFALVAASIAVPFRGAGAGQSPEAGTGRTGAGGGSSPNPTLGSGGPVASASPAIVNQGLVVAHVGDLATTGARSFTVPFTAPAPLPAGDPAVIGKRADGSFVAFDAVCTHAGCTVQWDRTDKVLLCPCHDAAFDPTRGAAVLQGPTNQPLASIPIVVDAASGAISLQA
ncbi:MAG: thiosulfate dehydrogenase (quinone) large subunit [Chloroflexota bacterium]|nr:thiosulfate dehydrogenase (quinone) large subunit [Chloroflexota bacterium]